MDTEAHVTERDRTPGKRTQERSRSAVRFFGVRAKRGESVDGRPLRRKAILLIVLPFIVLVAVNAFVAQPFLVPSESMENTLRVDDRILVNKLAYRFGNEVRRGDVVVFDGTGSFVSQGQAGRSAGGNPVTGLFRHSAALLGFARPGESDFTKRVIAVGGDHVVCCDGQGRIVVNGVAVEESRVVFPGDAPSEDPLDIAVPEGKLFVLGDHRSNSRDSRDHLGEPGGGMVPVDKVIGRADAVMWPPSRWRMLRRPHVYATVSDAAHG